MRFSPRPDKVSTLSPLAFYFAKGYRKKKKNVFKKASKVGNVYQTNYYTQNKCAATCNCKAIISIFCSLWSSLG